MKKVLIYSLIILGFALNKAHAYDFSAITSSGQTLYYNIKSSTSVECVGPGGESMGTWSGYSKPTGALMIPSSVTHSGMTYTVKSIAMYAFSQCTALTSITIPSSVKRIGSWAFYNDTALHTISLPSTGILWGQSVIQGTGWYDDQPNGIVYLGNTLVGYKGTLPNNYSIVIPSNIKSIAGNAFNPYYSGQSSGSIASITFPNSLEYIGDNAFHDLNITTLTLPSSLKGIGSYAFYGNLFSTVTLPNNIEYIGISAFGQCGSLTTIYYNAINANENDLILLSPFNNCSNFTSLYIGSSVQKIPAYIFSNCTSIQGTLSLPNSLNSIGQYAFQSCSGITGSLQIKNSVQTIGQMAFYGCTGITSITIGTAVDSIASSAFGGMTNLTTINYNAINCNYAQNVFTGNNLSHFNIGSSVQTIPDNLILNNPNLTSVTFPNTLTRIGSMNFTMCGLTGTLVLPASLAQVGYGAFNYCTNLTSIQCNATTPPTIEAQYGMAIAFNNGNWNTPLLVPCSSISAYQSSTGWSNFTNISGIGGCNYTVTLSVNNSAMETVSGGGTYTQGATATISATANSGYHFDHWSDGNTQNPRTITVTQDVTLTAYFAQDEVQTYTVTLNTNYATRGSVSGGGTYNAGTAITITATANNGYHFDHWSDGNTQTPRTITVNSDITLTAYFYQNTPIYTITAYAYDTTMGSVAGGGTYEQGTTITLTATANNGYHFVTWNDYITQNPRAITVDCNMTYIAIFEQNTPTYTVIVSSNNTTMGTVSGGGTFEEGATITLTATANDGYHFDHWSDGNTQNPRTIIVNGNVTLTAYFVHNTPTYTITVNSNNTTMGTVAGGGTYEQGATVQISAIPNNGYHSDHWSDGNTQNPRIITVNSNITLTAYFAPNTQYHTVTLSSNDYSMGTVTGGGQYEHGSLATCAAVPYNGYHFERWSDNNTQNPRNITVNSNITLTAYFAANTGIDDIEDVGIIVYAKDYKIHIDEAFGEEVTVYSIDGRTIASLPKATEHVVIPVTTTGVHIIKVGEHPVYKVVVIK